MPRIIDRSKCVACRKCERVCKVGCITQSEDNKRKINTSVCVDCGACQLACPMKCISQN